MSFAEVQKQAAALSPEERIELTRFLTTLRAEDSGRERGSHAKRPDRKAWLEQLRRVRDAQAGGGTPLQELLDELREDRA
ncbi:MAG TPA: hypothetical protein VEO95_08610 [Chthoniobacteraceae bacterium]|nr:hypothetical protein [Chthoniobacteraceae bacterium]